MKSLVTWQINLGNMGGGEETTSLCASCGFLNGRTALDPWVIVDVNPAVDSKMLVYSEGPPPAFTVYGLPSYPRFKQWSQLTIDGNFHVVYY